MNFRLFNFDLIDFNLDVLYLILNFIIRDLDLRLLEFGVDLYVLLLFYYIRILLIFE